MRMAESNRAQSHIGANSVLGAQVLERRSDDGAYGESDRASFSEERTLTNRQSEPIHRIVVGVDGSESSVAALEWALRQAELTGSALEAITTWEWPTNYGWAYPFPPEYDPKVDAQKMLSDALRPLLEAHPDVPVQTTVVEGHPAPVLVAASKGADVLVVGSRGHGEFAGMLIGSVSEHCATNAHCPVLVLRPSE